MTPTYPPRLFPGATIGVVAPAGPVHRKRVDGGISFLRKTGFGVRTGAHLYSREGYLAGSDRARAEDFMAMVRSPEVHAIFFARGGYGTARMLPHLDLDLLYRNPKIIMGFSDITILLIHILNYGNMVTYHGPVVSKLGVEVPPGTLNCMFSMLKQEFPVDLLSHLPDAGEMQVFRHGQGSGILQGGCLSLLQTLAGTDLEMDMNGKILFFEEVGERLYRIDRMLNHLSRTGCFEKLNGVIVGKLARCMSNSRYERKQFLSLLKHYFGSYTYPVVYDLPIGHTAQQLTLPQGGYCHIDTAAHRVMIDRN